MTVSRAYMPVREGMTIIITVPWEQAAEAAAVMCSVTA